jgi:hypothetical protein
MNKNAKTTNRLRSPCLFLVLLLLFLIAGCETAFIESAARGSLASFVTNVFSTAVNKNHRTIVEE